MRLRLAALLALTSASLVASQRPVPVPAPPPGPVPRSELRPRQVSVVVDGCMEDRRLKLARDSTTNPHEMALRATEYILEGPRELLAQLATDHRGHHEEVTGIAIIPPSPGGATVDTRTKTIGGARVTGAVRQGRGSEAKPTAQTPAVVDTPRPVRISVQAVTHLHEKCQPVN
jgi:hypothetical protein